MSKYLVGAIFGLVLGIGGALTCATPQAQTGPQPTRFAQWDQFEPYILSENVQRIAHDEGIWRQQGSLNLEDYVDGLTLVDMIGKKRVAEQLSRQGRVDIDEEYRAAFALLCFIRTPGKPPTYERELKPFRTSLAKASFASANVRRNALANVKSDAYAIPVDLVMKGALTPVRFFNVGAK